MQKIIGLDIGSYSIKAVEIVNTYKSYEISNFYENVIPQIDELTPDMVIPICMEQLFAENKLVADRIITAMPGQYVSSRIISFNFSDVHKIEAAVMAEVEDAVPFNLDEMIIDHQIIGQMQGKTVVLVVMTKKAFLGSFLDHLQRIQIDPKLVDVDSLSFYNLCPYLETDPDKIYGLVDVGHEKTSVCLFRNGVLRMFRSINLGGRYITEFLARDLEISFNEAQHLKHKVSYVFTEELQGDDLSAEEKIIADRITIACNSIIKELGRTLYAFKTWEKSPIEKIFLSGGSSTIRNFDRYFSDHLEVPTVPNHLERSDLKISSELSHKMPHMTQSIAIGIRAVSSVKRHSQINLRRDEFAFVQDYEALFRVAGTIAKVIAIVLLVLCLNYTIKYVFYTKEIADLQETYKKEFAAMASTQELRKKYTGNRFEFSKIRKETKTILQDEIDAKKKATEGFLSVNSDSGALVALQMISKEIPKDFKIDLVEYRFEAKPDGTGRVRLRIEADSYQTASNFQQALNKVSALKEISEKSSEPKPGSNIIIAVVEADYIPASRL